jgi:hypothetical protein
MTGLRDQKRSGSSSPTFVDRYLGGSLRFGGYVALMGALNLALLCLARPDVRLSRLALASGLLWLSSLPMFLYLQRPSREVPIFPVLNLLYFIYFGLPIFNDAVTVRGHPYEASEVTDAIALTLAGVACMQVTFYTPLGKAIELLPNLKMKADLERLTWYAVLMALIGVAASGFVLTGAKTIPPTFKAIAHVVMRLPLALLGGLYVLHLRNKLSVTLRVIALATYVLYVAMSLGSGYLSNVVFALLPMFFVHVAERGRLPILAGALCIVLLTPFARTKMEFRRALREREAGPLDRVSLFLSMTAEKALEEPGDFAEEATRTTSERTGSLGTFALVVNQTPRRVPYTEGKTYGVMLWAFVPRIFAPSRPDQPLGQEFGHRYRLLDYSDHRTSYNCAQIIEMYMNFGRVGVVVGMALVGLYYRFLYRLFNHGNGGDGMMLVSATALAGLLNIESDASNVLVGAFNAALATYAVLAVGAFAATRLIIVDSKQ